jgi:hypothetical protein
MVGELMTIPVRAGLRVTQFALRTTLSASARAFTIANGLVRSVTGTDGSGHEQWTPPPASPSRPARERSERVTTNGVDPRSTVTEPPPAPAASPEQEAQAAIEAEPVDAVVVDEPEPVFEEPRHVSEEPTLVEEFAEPGAEDGAGASITVEEPWSGYDQMTAKDVAARLVAVTPAELAAVQLYETTHKQRETVLSAVERELRKGAAADRDADSN